jgi:hypothetical protein
MKLAIEDHFTLVNSGSIVTLFPLTDEAKTWVEANVDIPDHMHAGEHGFHAEQRYAFDILSGFTLDVLGGETE